MSASTEQTREQLCANLHTLRQVVDSGDWKDVRLAAMRSMNRQAELLTLLEIVECAAVNHVALPDGMQTEIQKLLKP